MHYLVDFFVGYGAVNCTCHTVETIVRVIRGRALIRHMRDIRRGRATADNMQKLVQQAAYTIPTERPHR